MTRDEARAALLLAADDNKGRMPARYVKMGNEIVEYIAPVIFDGEKEIMRLADIAGQPVKWVHVDLKTLTVVWNEYTPEELQ